MEQLIRAALDREQVQLAYQPVVDLVDGRVVAAEALLRLRDAEGSPASAAQVVAEAERTGQILALGRSVLRTAALQAAAWRRELGRLVPVFVNVSALQVHDDGFVDDVLGALAAADLPPVGLSLELTESVLLTTDQAPLARLWELDRAGVSLALDDFGTGFDTLTYLLRLPATTLKIDRAFVAGVPHEERSTAIVDGVVALAKRCGLRTVAEGIETPAQAEHLAALGVYGQGYLLGRPASAAALGRWLAEGAPSRWSAATSED
ncbi:EAL domain-containing protein [Nocardioides ferulae]|uniref:EAL domain-containing protein n=1 Tax=Nocardioides ferulae TaxID=2340821 RepID=UPI000EAE803F|nr:EAL domain-containing protein [Nocardioides ferulae]